MKKFIFLATAAVAAAVLVAGIIILRDPLEYAAVNRITAEEKAIGEIYFVRNETVYYSASDGTVYTGLKDGERVKNNSVIASVYNGDVSNDVLKKLDTIDRKIINQRTSDNKAKLNSQSFQSLDSRINTKVKQIIEESDDNSVTDMGKYKNEINAVRAGMDERAGEEIERLEAEKTAVEAENGLTKSDIVSDSTGVFSTYLDGLENVLTPEKAMEMKPSFLDGIVVKDAEQNNRQTQAGEAVCKLMNNHRWYALMVMSAQRAAQGVLYGQVQLRFNDISQSLVSGKIVYISEEENGQVLVLAECTNYTEPAFAFRKTDGEMIFKSYEGYQIPSSAVLEDEKGTYLVCQKGKRTYNIYCDIVYSSDKGFVIVDSKPDSERKISAMDRIVVSGWDSSREGSE